jgi:FlaA1/EpsC-like NDP-sugar epimerase
VGPEALLGASLLTGLLWAGLRMGCVTWHQWQEDSEAGVREQPPARRTLIIGAGRAGILLCQALREHSRHRCVVVGFVDDALEKQGVRIHGVPVLGPTALLPTYIREQRATQVILGMAGIPGAKLRELAGVARREGVEVKTVPGVQDLVGDRPWKPEVRDIAIEDLLRREPIVINTAAIQARVEGRVVLITGGGGSIGSELARRMAELRPERLVLLGRGENSLWLAQRELASLFPRQRVDLALCDIRNPQRLDQVFRSLRPEVVLHAAAHKHVPFLECNPEEAIGNNIFGTRNVLDAALDSGTRTFVNISTDKAVNPVNVLGVSKRIAEIITANEAAHAGAELCLTSVRFGNVLGSRGSVVPIFREQIRRGGPVTVTHPDMVRFFMTIPEAAQLALQAGLLGDNGKVFALDMGDPVHIVELAWEMIRLSGYSPGVEMGIRFTGVRPGEKLFEELFIQGEERKSGIHPKVFEALQDPLDRALLNHSLRRLEHILTYPGRGRRREILDCFMQLVPSYRPSASGLGRFLAEAPLNAPETVHSDLADIA